MFYIFIIQRTCKFIWPTSAESMDIINSQRFIFAIWHSRILIFPTLYNAPKVTAIVSAHGDGEFIASLLKRYRHSVIRGSSRKQSFLAMKALLSAIKNSNRSICITPDGPKGPRYHINGNITNIAGRYNIPVVSLCFSATHAIVLKTWDRFIIPLPFSKIYLDISPPYYFNPNETDGNLFLTRKMFDQMIFLDQKTALDVDY